MFYTSHLIYLFRIFLTFIPNISAFHLDLVLLPSLFPLLRHLFSSLITHFPISYHYFSFVHPDILILLNLLSKVCTLQIFVTFHLNIWLHSSSLLHMNQIPHSLFLHPPPPSCSLQIPIIHNLLIPIFLYMQVCPLASSLNCYMLSVILYHSVFG